VDEREVSTWRREVAQVLIVLSIGLANLLAIASSTGALIVILVLAIKGTISVVLALVLAFVGMPFLFGVAKMLAMLIGIPLLSLARLADRDTTDRIADSRAAEDYY
jgi:hypothetical protein